MDARFCSQCGAPMEPGTKYCGNCGSSASREPSKKRMTKEEPKKFAVGWKIFFLLLAAIFLYRGTCTFVVGFFGNWSTPKNATFNFNKATVNGNRNDYDWWINYDFFVEETGKTCHSTSYWKGTYTVPKSGYSKYYVNYLPARPSINHLSKYKPVVRCKDFNDKVEGGFLTVLGTLIQFAAMYLLLVLAEMPVPWPFGKKKKSKSRK